jgi:pimeloyl-ACP methyl ester carboxylesterase
MLTRLARPLCSVFALSLLLGPTAQAQPPAGGSLVTLRDGRHIYLQCSGAGSPTVILESGFAGSSRSWGKVEPLVAKKRRVCAYDRAGYGRSDEGPMPRDGRAVARDLDQALRRARIGGPYVLVGHSAGGLYVRLFAARRPRSVVGMVLVDPMVEHQDARFAERFGPGAASLGSHRALAERCLAAVESLSPECGAHSGEGAETYQQASPAQRKAVWETQISELDALYGATSDEVDAGPKSFGDLPVIVLTAGAGEAAAPGFWAQLHADLARRLSSRGQARIVAGSSHLITVDRPEAISDAIDEVISEAAQGTPATTRRTAPVSASTSASSATNEGVK